MFFLTVFSAGYALLHQQRQSLHPLAHIGMPHSNGFSVATAKSGSVAGVAAEQRA